MEALRSSETSAKTKNTRCLNPEDDFLHCHRRENLKTYMVLIFVDQFAALSFTPTGALSDCEVHMNFGHESICLLADTVRNQVFTLHRSQEMLQVPSLYAQTHLVPAALQEYLQSPYKYFRLVLPLEGYCRKLCASNNPRREDNKIKTG
jgi:hypothetical protein